MFVTRSFDTRGGRQAYIATAHAPWVAKWHDLVLRIREEGGGEGGLHAYNVEEGEGY